MWEAKHTMSLLEIYFQVIQLLDFLKEYQVQHILHSLPVQLLIHSKNNHNDTISFHDEFERPILNNVCRKKHQ